MSSISFSSEDDTVLSVESDGKYTAKKYGRTKISVDITYVSGMTGNTLYTYDQCTISFEAVVYPDMSGVKLSKSEAVICFDKNYSGFWYFSDENEGAKIKIKSSYIFDENDEMTDFYVDSSNEDINVYAELKDNVITLRTYNPGKTNVTIHLNGVEYKIKLKAYGLLMNTDSVLLSKGSTKQLKLKGAKLSGIKWSSTDKSVAKVNKNGLVRAKKSGVAVITARIGGTTFGSVVNVTTPEKISVIKKARKIAENGVYDQGKRMIEGYYDCSSLVWKAYKTIGLNLGASGYAPVAADEAKYLDNTNKRVGKFSEKTVQGLKMQPGDLVFFEGFDNNRYLNIYHVEMFTGYYYAGMYNGKPYVLCTWANRNDGYAGGGGLDAIVCRP